MHSIQFFKFVAINYALKIAIDAIYYKTMKLCVLFVLKAIILILKKEVAFNVKGVNFVISLQEATFLMLSKIIFDL